MDCPFCKIPAEKFITESELAFAIGDIHPVSKGHSLVIPKVHTENYFDLKREQKIACWDLVSELKVILQERYNPGGYNVGLNINRIAGQSVLHAHIHIIPRYSGKSGGNFSIENMASKLFSE
ncbi:MAG: HIT family protein [Ignavibacteriae bacterium]|nr:HIT family protein [Ignavibacteriota bacterium]